MRDPKTSQLKNAPHVDNSCKWAGGGIVSTSADLLKFGNAMLYSHQENTSNKPEAEVGKKPYLKSETMDQLWGPVIRVAKDPKNLK